jgi:hypothetical protein
MFWLSVAYILVSSSGEEELHSPNYSDYFLINGYYKAQYNTYLIIY